MDSFIDDIFDDDFFRQEQEFTSSDDNRRNLVCIIFPAGTEDLQILPEGDRYNPTIKVLTQEEVKVKDLLFWNGHRWRIITNARWNDYGYYDSLATRYEGSQTDDSDGFEIT
ncbi:hypothetical protein [Xenorhabdus griffiniae]|uniref:hypothetical protein n=1 Tax=Xenorhabdus griffiniae TaxID=351672 RepID=UPI00235950A4|nr:hypothetical protein [Xenorhabdus griffiniae]MDC9606858.1 hypothetical protein [Xenorhabdus griffiniae]